MLLIDRLMCVAVVALTFMFYYFYRFLLSSCVCQLLVKFMMMMTVAFGATLDVKSTAPKPTVSATEM